MLINISNHLFNDWDELQKQEAIKQFREVIDYPFPRVNPAAALSEINALADKIVNAVRLKFEPPYSVHVVGEFTLCYQLVNRFLALKIPCYASTTRKGDDDFVFVQFRPYFHL